MLAPIGTIANDVVIVMVIAIAMTMIITMTITMIMTNTQSMAINRAITSTFAGRSLIIVKCECVVSWL